jgi:hypothetical protein
MTSARASDDLPLPEAPSRSAKRAASRPWRRSASRVSSALRNLLATPEEDRRVRFLKGQKARIRRPFGIPIEHILRIESPFQETDPEPAIALSGLGREVDVLNVAEDPARRAGLHLDRKDRLAALPRLHQLRKTPFGGQPTGRQERNHRLALAQLPIERLLPAAAAFDPRLRVEIEEQRSMALCFQPSLRLRRRRVVGAAVAVLRR